ncbi:hypothetical protein KC361_g284 [Hortaea werneckii]|nr:hypothetical protein KC361_g284 [Hortaea werneckii]
MRCHTRPAAVTMSVISSVAQATARPTRLCNSAAAQEKSFKLPVEVLVIFMGLNRWGTIDCAYPTAAVMKTSRMREQGTTRGGHEEAGINGVLNPGFLTNKTLVEFICNLTGPQYVGASTLRTCTLARRVPRRSNVSSLARCSFEATDITSTRGIVAYATRAGVLVSGVLAPAGGLISHVLIRTKTRSELHRISSFGSLLDSLNIDTILA